MPRHPYSQPTRWTAWSDDAIVEEFRRSRQESYAALAGDVEKVLERGASRRPRRGTRAPAMGWLLELFRERLAAIESVDFFGSAGRDRVVAALKQIEKHGVSGNRVPTSGRSRIMDLDTYRERL